MDEILNIFHSACQFVLNKQEKKKNSGCRISCSVPWADFDKKIFSPVFAVYWQTQTPTGGNLTLNPYQYLPVVASRLGVSPAWIESVVNCYSQINRLETNLIINLDNGELQREVYQNVLVETWTPDGISSLEVAERLKESYPPTEEPTYSANKNWPNVLPNEEVKRNLTIKLWHLARLLNQYLPDR